MQENLNRKRITNYQNKVSMKILEMRAVVSTYKAKDGSEKNEWAKIGKVFVGDDGSMGGILMATPLNWNGQFRLFDPQARQGQQQQHQPQQQSMFQKNDLPFG